MMRAQLVSLVCFVWAASACVDAGAPRSEVPDDDLLYVATLDDGSTFEVYQQEDGVLVLSGVTPSHVTPLPARYDLAQPITDLHLQLFPDRAVPEVLVRAEAQSYARRAPDTSELATSVLPAPERGVRAADKLSPAQLTASQFQAEHCNTDRLTDQSRRPLRHLNWCRTNWANGFHSGEFRNVRQSYSAVDVLSGTVTFRRSWRVTGAASYTVTDWSVPTGTTRWAEAHSGSDSTGIDAFFEVLNASNDGFHASALWADRLNCVFQGFICAGFPTGCTAQVFACNDGTVTTSGCLGPCTP